MDDMDPIERLEFAHKVQAGIRRVHQETGKDGASLHAATTDYDEGERYVVTGPGVQPGEYGSAAAAFAAYHALWKSYSIWRIDENGQRTLVYR